MEMVDEERFERAEGLPKLPKKEKQFEELSEQEFQNLLEDMQNPVKAQQQLAVQVKVFLDKRIKEELEVKGFLTDHTRRWVEAYNNILEKIQKALYGDRSVNLHVHKVTHSQISSRIREVMVVEKKKKRKVEI